MELGWTIELSRNTTIVILPNLPCSEESDLVTLDEETDASFPRPVRHFVG